MTRRILPWIAAAALVSAAGCGSDDEDNEPAATTTAPAVGQATTTTEDPVPTTVADDDDDADGGELSPEGRAVLAATEDLAGDVSETAQEFAEGSIDDEEATARLELARDRAADLRARAEKLPAADEARSRLASLNEEIGDAADDVSALVAAGRSASRDEIETRIDELRDDARSAFDDVRELLDRPAQERFREALDRIGVRAPG
jgi:chromosome segregation ATPase